MSNVIARAIGIQEGEETLLGRLWLQSACIGIPRLLTQTSANSLFLRAFDAGSLPYAYAATAMVVPLVGFVLLRIGRGARLVPRLAGLLGALLVAQIAFRFAFAWAPGKASALAFLIWLGLEFAFGYMVTYDLSGRLLDVRQAKRLFALAATGEVTATIVGGLLVPSIVARVGTENLLWLAAAGHALGLVVLFGTARAFADRLREPGLGEGSSTKTAEQSSSPSQRRHGRFLLALGALTYGMYFVIENACFERAEAYLQDSEAIAAFLGRFFAFTGLATLASKTFLAGRWLARFGILGSLASTPILVSVGCVATIVVGRSSDAVAPVFWVMAATMLVERVVTSSLHTPGFFAVYMPIPPAYRARLQTLGTTVVNQLATGTAGILLLFFNKVLHFTAVELCMVAIGGFCVWGAVAVAATKSYRVVVAEALSRRGMSGQELSFEDPDVVRALERGLASEHPRDVVQSLELLFRGGAPDLDADLRKLFDHRALSVRLAAYEKAAALRSRELFGSLAARLRVERDPRAKGALLVAFAACGEHEAFEPVSALLDDPEAEVQRGAIVALLAHCGLEGAVAAGERLLALLRSTRAEDRIAGASVLAEVGVPSFHRGLVPLLDDADPEVQKAALAAAGALGSEPLFPRVLHALSVPSLRHAAIEALVRGGEHALGAIEAALSAREGPARDLGRIARIAGRIGGARATSMLVGMIADEDRELRRDVLRALCHAGYRADAAGGERIDAVIEAELRHAAAVLACARDIGEGEDVAMLRSSLEGEIDDARERLFLLLSLIYDAATLRQIEDNYRFGTPEKRGFAIELFDNALARRHKELILPLLEDVGDAERLRRLSARFPQQAMDREARLRSIAEEPERWKSEWLTLCAMHARGGSKAADEAVRKVEALRAAGLFASLPANHLRDIALGLVELSVGEHETVISRGELGTSLYIVASGAVRVHRGPQVLAELRAGEVFGELSALSSQPRMASVTATEPSRLLELRQEALHEIMADRIEIARDVCGVLCARLRETILRDGTAEAMADASGILNAGMTLLPQRTEAYMSEVDRVIVLRSASLFEKTPESILAEVANGTKMIWLDAGKRLFRKGDLATSLYVIVDGRVRVHDGDRDIIELGARAVLGELSALSSQPRTATVTALEPTRLISLDQASLYDLMWGQADVVQGLLSILVTRMADLEGEQSNESVISRRPPQEGAANTVTTDRA